MPTCALARVRVHGNRLFLVSTAMSGLVSAIDEAISDVPRVRRIEVFRRFALPRDYLRLSILDLAQKKKTSLGTKAAEFRNEI